MKHFYTFLFVIMSVTLGRAQTYYVCCNGKYDVHHAATASYMSYAKRTGKVTIGNLQYAPADIDSIVFTRPTDIGMNTVRWMACLPNTTPLRRLTIPGAHDAATKNCSSVGQCQSLTISEMLNAGVRALDLRPRYTAESQSDITLSKLEIYHGMLSTGVLFKDAVADIVSFLKENPKETVIINLQKESSGDTDYSSTWRTAIRTCLGNNSSYVLSQLTATTTLNACRGKMVIISHNPYGNEGVYNDVVYGALTESWGDDASFTTNLLHTYGSTVAKAHVTDNYNATTASSKQAYIKANLDEASAADSDYYISFTNVAWTFFGGLPKDYAKTHNAWLNGRILSGEWPGALGIVYQDFCADSECTPELVTNLILQNHRSLWP